METTLIWQWVNESLPTDNSEIFIHTEFCRYKIAIAYYNWHNFLQDWEVVMNVNYWCYVPKENYQLMWETGGFNIK